MPEAAYSGHAVHGWRRGMFRRRTDFSWPLILVLVGLFFLSLKLPRQWERIARPTALALKPHKSLPDQGVAFGHGQPAEVSPLEVFRSIKPAGQVASNTDSLANSAPSANYEHDLPSSCLSWSRNRPWRKCSGCRACRRTGKGCGCCRNAKRQADRQGRASRAEHLGQPVLPPPRTRQTTLHPRLPEKTDEVRVLRDVPASLPGPSLGPDSTAPAEPEVRRLPPPEHRSRPGPAVRASERRFRRGSSTSAVHR